MADTVTRQEFEAFKERTERRLEALDGKKPKAVKPAATKAKKGAKKK